MNQLATEEETGKIVNFKDVLNLEAVLSEEGATFEVNFDDCEEEIVDDKDEPINIDDFKAALLDEETYIETVTFQEINEKMENLVDDGGIRKRILREGIGGVVPENATVSVHFNAYLEFNSEPFDSSYHRKKPHTFILNEGNTILGMEMAVQSMRMNEKSQFLIKPEYAYGPLGCLSRVPPDSTVLFEIELINFVDAGASRLFPALSEAEQRDFKQIHKYAHALCSKGNDLFSKGCIKAAIKEYNTAVFKLESCTLRDYEEEEKQYKLLLRILTNLVVAYTKVEEPRRACNNCNKVYYICDGTSLRVPTKVYFNHGRCLILLGCYSSAERRLKQAQRQEPENVEITNELLKLDRVKKLEYVREKVMAKAMFNKTDKGISEDFKMCIGKYCSDLLSDDNSMHYNLPRDLTQAEYSFCKAEAEKHGLQLGTCKGRAGGYFIAKVKNE
ncbi:hypothetical protein FQA39_LY17960 [Lamprigera yunnana]|nr:hypothetical protein FQA39_LY17960 [Lamprigera yunnana]